MSPANDRQLDWAREELGLDATAGEAEARRAFLTQLAVDKFVPTFAKMDAFSVYRGDLQEPSSRAYQEVERLRTKEQVEQFAERIFLYSPVERRKEWETLRACSADLPGSWAVLDRLQPALELDFEQIQLPGDLRELAEHLRELFVLPPVKRAERRSAIIESCRQDSRKWERAARSMASKHSNVAALDSPLIEQLSTWSRSEKVMRKPPRVKGPPRTRAKEKFWNINLSERPWLIVVVLFFLSHFVRLATTNWTTETRPTPPVYRSPNLQHLDYRTNTVTPPHQINSFKELEEYINKGNASIEPTSGMPPPDVEQAAKEPELFQRIGDRYIQERASTSDAGASPVGRPQPYDVPDLDRVSPSQDASTEVATP